MLLLPSSQIRLMVACTCAHSSLMVPVLPAVHSLKGLTLNSLEFWHLLESVPSSELSLALLVLALLIFFSQEDFTADMQDFTGQIITLVAD